MGSVLVYGILQHSANKAGRDMKSKEQLHDELLMTQATNGNNTAFAELVARWTPRLYYYIKKLVIHECDVDDILQNVWLALYRILGEIRDISQYRVFLFATARCKAIDYLRRKKCRMSVEVSADWGQEPIYDQEAGEEEIDSERLHQALDRLDASMRDILTLYYLRELSLAELACVLDIPQGTVKSRLHYARKALRKEIERYGNASATTD